jgi:enamine deaminase RidA (YjgF/YER057c/UK114 family)
MTNLTATLAAAGCDIGDDVARVYQWFVSPHPSYDEFVEGISWPRIRSIASYVRSRNEVMREPRPASTSVACRELVVPGALVGVDLIALDPGYGVQKLVPELPADIPASRSGYELAVRCGDWIFLSGQTPSDFKGDWESSKHMGEPSGLAPEARVNPYLWLDSEIEAQTEDTLRRLDAIASAVGTTLQRCVKAEVYIGHPSDFAGMDRVWKRWFPTNPPARVVVPFIGQGIKGIRLEIEMKLLAGDSELTIEPIETADAPEPFGHEPQAVRAGDFLFFSTQLPVDATGAVPPELRRDPNVPYFGRAAKRQMHAILTNMAAICRAAGTSLENVCRILAFYDDLDHLAETIEVWADHFPEAPPTAAAIRVGGPFLLSPGAHVLLDAIGYVPQGPRG